MFSKTDYQSLLAKCLKRGTQNQNTDIPVTTDLCSSTMEVVWTLHFAADQLFPFSECANLGPQTDIFRVPWLCLILSDLQNMFTTVLISVSYFTFYKNYMYACGKWSFGFGEPNQMCSPLEITRTERLTKEDMEKDLSLETAPRAAAGRQKKREPPPPPPPPPPQLPHPPAWSAETEVMVSQLCLMCGST